MQTHIMEVAQLPTVEANADPATWLRSRQDTGRIVAIAIAPTTSEPRTDGRAHAGLRLPALASSTLGMSETSSGRPTSGHGAAGAEVVVDVAERGAPRDGKPQALDRRLFMQLLVFECPERDPAELPAAVGKAIAARGVPAVVYEDATNPRGLGVLTWSEDPAAFVTAVRPALNAQAGALRLRPDLTMFGRTYSSGYEPDLEQWLLRRAPEAALNPAWPWAVWYPLRRTGDFAKLDGREQGAILREHGTIGRAYGEKGLAHDIRLACHALDARDNEFVIGLVGPELHPLSHLVQAMRKTRQTAEFVAQMGPFFVGRVAYRASP
jgi:chlorite dismutase